MKPLFKLLALGAVAAVGISSTALADDDFSTRIEIYGGFAAYANASGNAFFPAPDAGLLGGSATIATPFSDGWSGQIDLVGSTGINGDDGAQFASSIIGGLHIGHRDGDDAMYGFFVGGGTGAAESEETGNLWFVGVEGQLPFEHFVLYGQGGWLDSKESDGDNSDTFHDAWFARAVGRYELSRETMLQGEVAFADGEQDTGNSYDMEIWGWGARVEHQLASPRLAVFAAYEGAHYDNTVSTNTGDQGKYVEHVGKIGIVLHLSGNEGMTALDLPNLGRWVASGDAVD